MPLGILIVSGRNRVPSPAAKIIAFKCYWNCSRASSLGMVTISGNSQSSFIEGGRAIQRVWLEITSQGLALQPIIGLTLLINRLNNNALDGFSEKHTQFVKKAADTLPELFDINKSDTMVMGFRIGLPKNKVEKTLTF